MEKECIRPLIPLRDVVSVSIVRLPYLKSNRIVYKRTSFAAMVILRLLIVDEIKKLLKLFDDVFR